MAKRLATIGAGLLGGFLLVSCTYEMEASPDPTDVEEAPEEALAFAEELLLAEGELLEEDVSAEPVPDTCVSRVDASVTFETMPGISCGEVLNAANHVLVPFGYAPDTRGVFAEAARICQNLDTELVYWPESPQIPALADALVGTLCPGDRSLVVEADGPVPSVVVDLDETTSG